MQREMASGREFGSELNRDSNLDNVDASSSVEHDEKATGSSGDGPSTSVAHLRNFLNDFGRKNKEHFEKSRATSMSAEHIQKAPVRRPKVRSSLETPIGPTPLPKEAASVLVRRIMKPSASSSGVAAAATKFKAADKPATIKNEVEATNEGYASVEKLCKWLADDPTNTNKKSQPLRRGANVLAKSRAFDKGLVHTIAAEHKIKQGSVSHHKKQLETRVHVAATTNSSSINIGSRRETVGGMRPERKTWAPVVPVAPKPAVATSETVTRSDEVDTHAEASKQQWRDRVQQAKMQPSKILQQSKMQQLKPKTQQPQPKDTGTLAMKVAAAADDEEEEEDVDDDRSEVGSSVTVVAAKPQPPGSNSSSSQLLESILTDHENDNEASMFIDTPSECSQATVEASMPPTSSSKCSLDFRQVREIAVKRSESNGSAEEVVQLRKKKFEQIQKDLRRKTGTYGLLKASWEGEEGGNYVKKYVSDIPPKRALHELP
jgi:hypothetical protein